MQRPCSQDGDIRSASSAVSPHVYVAGVAVVAAFVALVAHQIRVPIPDSHAAKRNVRAILTRIDPNTATLAELSTLPGIGETKAQCIIAFRESHRGIASQNEAVFRRPQDLAGVKGIGPRTVEKLRPWLRFDK